MDEVELVKALGDVWDDAGDIIESLHALRKRIEAIYAGGPEGDDFGEVYELAEAQVDLVLNSFRVTLGRIESGVRLTMRAKMGLDQSDEDEGGEDEGGEAVSDEGETVATAPAASAEPEVAASTAPEPTPSAADDAIETASKEVLSAEAEDAAKSATNEDAANEDRLPEIAAAS